MIAADDKTNGEMQIAFGKIPLAVIATGAIAKLNRSCLLVYLAIAAHINGKSWEATPAIETLVRCTGLHKRSVQRAILKLQDFALITTECGGGRHLRNTYLLATKPAAETVASECHPLAAETVAFRHRKGGISAPKRWRPDATPTARTARTAAAAEAAAGSQPEEAEIIKTLRAAGITNPKLDKLAETPGVTADLVRAEAAKLVGTNKRTGVLILNIEAAAVQALAAAKTTADAAESDAIDEQKRRQKVSKRALAVQAAFATVKGMSGEQRATVLQDVLAHVTDFKRGTWETADPETNEGLALAMAHTAAKAVTP